MSCLSESLESGSGKSLSDVAHLRNFAPGFMIPSSAESWRITSGPATRAARQCRGLAQDEKANG